MKKFHLKFQQLCLRLSWLPRLLAQVTIGVVFIESGWGKLHHLDKVIAFFESLGIPAPHLQAPMVAGVELVCGALIFIGWATRFAALPLICTMSVAVITAKVPEFETWTDLFGTSEFLMIVVLFYLVTYGASPISVDGLVQRKLTV